MIQKEEHKNAKTFNDPNWRLAQARVSRARDKGNIKREQCEIKKRIKTTLSKKTSK